MPTPEEFSWFDLPGHTILEVVHGSHAYGLNNADSDFDIRGVAVAPMESYLGTRGAFEQNEDRVTDHVTWDIRKFARLAAGSNPNVLEILSVPVDCIRIVTTLGQRLFDARDLFPSMKARGSYLEYARSQFEKARKVHRWMLLNGDTSSLSPADIKSYTGWLNERNDKNRAMEEKCGYNPKHMSHCFRLLHQAKILFDTGHVVLRLSLETRDLIKSIKAGNYPIEDLIQSYEDLYADATGVVEANKAGLPPEPDHGKISVLVRDIILDFHARDLAARGRR